MIGRELDALFPDRGATRSDAVLEVCEPSGRRRLRAGVVLGQRRARSSDSPAWSARVEPSCWKPSSASGSTTSGDIQVRGTHVKRNQPAAAITAGMAMVPEDRKVAGVVLSMSVLDNGIAAAAVVVLHRRLARGKARTKAVSDAMPSVRLRSSGLGQLVGTLSGGNQQKVVLARWLTGNVKVLLLDEPTRGVDVGARSEIYRIVSEFAEAAWP